MIRLETLWPVLTRGRAWTLIAAFAGVALAVPSVADDKPEAESNQTAKQKKSELIRALTEVQLAEVNLAQMRAKADLQRAAQQSFVANSYVLIEAPTDGPFGASLSPADKALRAQLDLPADHGLVISNIVPGGPAAQVGLQNNDVLLELNSAGLNSQEALTAALKSAGDKPVALRLVRAGKPIELPLKSVYRVTFGPVVAKSPTYYIGVEINLPDDVLRAQVKELPAEQGLVAIEVLPDSPAQKAGLKPFDILLESGNKPLSDSKDLVAQVQDSAGKPLTLKVLRNGKVQTFEVTPQARTDAAGNDENSLNRYLAVRWMAQPRPVLARAVPQGTAVEEMFSTTRQAAPLLRTYTAATASQRGMPQGNQGTSGTATTAKVPAGLEKRLDVISSELADLRRALDDLKKALSRQGDSAK